MVSVEEVKVKKCQPFKCTWFQEKWVANWRKVPMDVFMVKCPFREGNKCTNEKQKLEKELVM